MANVKISNLPAESDVNNIIGFAGYNAAGTCKISGADLINSLPSSTPTLQQVLDSGNTADSNGNTGTIVLTNSAQNRTATYGNENISTTISSFGIDVNGSNNGISLDSDDGFINLSTNGTNFIILNGRTKITGQSNQLDPGSGLTTTWSLFNSNYLLDGYNTTSGAGGDIRINSRGSLTMHTGNLSTSTPGGALSIFARGNTASLSTVDGSTLGGNVTISSSSGDVVITGGGNLVLTNTGLGTPAVGDVLTASTTAGVVEWTTPSSGGAFSPIDVASSETAPTAATTQYYYQTIAGATMTISKAKLWGFQGTNTVLFGIYRGTFGSLTLIGQGSATCSTGPNVINLVAEPGQSLSVTAGEDIVVGFYPTGTSWRTIYDDGISDIAFGISNTANITSMPASPTGGASGVRFACTLY